MLFQRNTLYITDCFYNRNNNSYEVHFRARRLKGWLQQSAEVKRLPGLVHLE